MLLRTHPSLRTALAAVLLSACASVETPMVAWTIQQPTIESGGNARLLSVVAEACEGADRKLTCNTALNRARALLSWEARALLELIGKPVDTSLEVDPTERRLTVGTARDAWIQRAVTTVAPSEVWTSDGDDCIWVLARLNLSEMVTDPNAPLMASRALDNHLRTIVPDPATPTSGTTCEN